MVHTGQTHINKKKGGQPVKETTAQQDPPKKMHRHRRLPDKPEALMRAMFRKADGKPPLPEQYNAPLEDHPECLEDEGTP